LDRLETTQVWGARAEPTTLHDERGGIYVEFVIAFIPFFILFLGFCQLTLVTAAYLTVSHAATAAVRSAIVVLDDTADIYAGAPRGVLSGRAQSQPARASLLGWLGTNVVSPFTTNDENSRVARFRKHSQQGARMAPIRLAAEVPLMAIAPSQSTASQSVASLERNLVMGAEGQLGFASAYTAVATAVTIHSSDSSEELAPEPITATAPITVRVSYLYYCGVPVVRSLMCSSLATLLTQPPPERAAAARRLTHFANPLALAALLKEPAYYAILTAQATLPNQGSHGDPTEGEQ
jgi:hypothetical protein